MSDPLSMIMAGAAGAALGGVFFGGLWWTVRKGVLSPHPVLWFLGSLLVRMSIVLVGFYFVGGGQWERLLVCLLGFGMARFVVMWLTRPSHENPGTTTKEASHAP